jgi:hypothetical protein
MMPLLFHGDQTETQPDKLLYIKCYVQYQHVSCTTSHYKCIVILQTTQDLNYTAKKECTDITAKGSKTFQKLRHKYKIEHQLSQEINPSVWSA